MAIAAPVPEQTEAPSASDRWPFLFFVLVGVAALLRLRGLVSFPFEQDELYTLRDAISLRVHPSGAGNGIGARPVYYVLQHFLLGLTGDTPLGLRLLPWIFGMSGVVLLFLLGRRLGGVAAGLVAVALVAFSPWHQYASGMARYWTLVFALSTAALYLLLRAFAGRRRTDYLLASLALIIGTFTHPSFVFAAFGYCAALFLVDDTGRFRIRFPSKDELLYLWAPLVLVSGAAAAALKFTGHGGAIRNGLGRGLIATLRVVPGMVEWMTLPVAMTAFGGAVLMIVAGTPAFRRFGVMTVLGVLSSMTLLTISGLFTDVYADYGMAMLPLVYVTIGATLAWILSTVQPRLRPWGYGIAVSALLAAEFPGLLSNLVDGMRFDPRAPYRYVQEYGRDRLVVGWPTILQRRYAPDVRFLEFPVDGALGLERTLRAEGSFWLLVPYVRNGLLYDNGWTRRWVELKCRTVYRAEKQRFDYRVYRLDLAWCGSAPPPGPLGRMPFDSAQ